MAELIFFFANKRSYCVKRCDIRICVTEGNGALRLCTVRTNFLFFLDIIVTFHSAIITDDHNVIDDKKLIAHAYLRGWFVTDVLSCIPYGDLGSMILSKKASTKIQVIKLIKLLRISKIVKEK